MPGSDRASYTPAVILGLVPGISSLRHSGLDPESLTTRIYKTRALPDGIALCFFQLPFLKGHITKITAKINIFPHLPKLFFRTPSHAPTPARVPSGRGGCTRECSGDEGYRSLTQRGLVDIANPLEAILRCLALMAQPQWLDILFVPSEPLDQ